MSRRRMPRKGERASKRERGGGRRGGELFVSVEPAGAFGRFLTWRERPEEVLGTGGANWELFANSFTYLVFLLYLKQTEHPGSHG